MATDRAHRRLLTEFTLTPRIVVAWELLGTVAGLAALAGFVGFYAVGTGRPMTDPFAVVRATPVATGLIVVAAIGAVTVLHEGIHAAVIRWFGGDVSFGVGIAHYVLPYAYVTTTEHLRRDQFFAVLLAPFVVITVVGVLAMVALEEPLLVYPLTFNAAGAVGDLWIGGLLVRHPPGAVVEDSPTGLRIYAPGDGHSHRTLPA